MQILSQQISLAVKGALYVATSGETLWRDNCQLIAMLVIVLARQAQKNRN